MKATHFRAYGSGNGLSRRLVDGAKVNIEHPVEDVVVEGRLKDGKAEFNAKDEISRVVFYSGNGDEATVVGSVDVGKSGKVSAQLHGD